MPTYPANSTLAANQEESGLLRLLERLLQPVARLCLAHGITFATVSETLKRAFVHEAKGFHPEAQGHGMVSRISTATGINRREVTRLTNSTADAAVTKQPVASELLARWTTDRSFRDEEGAPLVLKRVGETESFEALAHLITRDIHPRSILDELVRLGFVSHDKESDTVSVVQAEFVPRADLRQMLSFLSDNVGDHLEAAVENVTTSGNPHLEQAIFADELSAESVKILQPRIVARWQALREEMVPFIAGLIEADKLAGRPQDQRIRIGLYSYNTAEAGCRKTSGNRVARRFRTAAPKKANV